MLSPRKKFCDNCHEELSVSAYYRHREHCYRSAQVRSAATSRAKLTPESGSNMQSSGEDSDVCVSSDSSDTDSSFCLDTNERDSSSSLSKNNDGELGMEFEPEEPSFTSSSSDSDTTLPSDDNEIWDISDSDGESCSDANIDKGRERDWKRIT